MVQRATFLGKIQCSDLATWMVWPSADGIEPWADVLWNNVINAPPHVELDPWGTWMQQQYEHSIDTSDEVENRVPVEQRQATEERQEPRASLSSAFILAAGEVSISK
jgi:hypothetical protein